MRVIEQVVDGFTLDQGFTELPFTLPALVTGQLETLRRAVNLRPRWYQFPTVDPTVAVFPTLGLRGNYEKQFRVEPGSWLWGYTAFGPFSFSVWEEETGRRFSFDFLQAQDAGAGLSTRIPGVRSRLAVLGEPWVILKPGLVNVELYAVAPALGAVTAQELVLWFAEPVCAVEREMSPCA
jgi:hypothetical protein